MSLAHAQHCHALSLGRVMRPSMIAEQPAYMWTCWTMAGLREPSCLAVQGMAASPVSKAQILPLKLYQMLRHCSMQAGGGAPFMKVCMQVGPGRHEGPLQTSVSGSTLLCRDLNPNARPVTLGSQSATAERGCLAGSGRRLGEAGSAVRAALPRGQWLRTMCSAPPFSVYIDK